MTSGNKSSLVMAIMFARVDEMHGDLPEVFGWDPIGTFVQEGVVVINLRKLKLRAILPLGVSVLLIKLHSLLVVLGNKDTIHVDVLGSPRMEFGLVGVSQDSLLGLGNLLQTRQSPTRSVEETMFLGINGNSYTIGIVDS